MTPPIEPPGASENQAAEDLCPECGASMRVGNPRVCHGVNGVVCLRNQLATALAKLAQREQTVTMANHSVIGVWVWQGGGEDYLESLTCPILIAADDMRELQAKLAERDAEVERLKKSRVIETVARPPFRFDPEYLDTESPSPPEKE